MKTRWHNSFSSISRTPERRGSFLKAAVINDCLDSMTSYILIGFIYMGIKCTGDKKKKKNQNLMYKHSGLFTSSGMRDL